DFLRKHLVKKHGMSVLCYSGRGGELPAPDGTWRVITRDESKRIFREKAAEVLLCTDAAAEGLNFQFCGALVNYSMPWNPMKGEQRIGRIDRLGSAFRRFASSICATATRWKRTSSWCCGSALACSTSSSESCSRFSRRSRTGLPRQPWPRSSTVTRCAQGWPAAWQKR
ncbi:MAG: SWF/SNF helicase family protein, partial [Candidatus Schekmanbacteria bacterium]|nr:SWF/SNF helicase family protein [Candidatus Schekmanbacteria bacterium]